MKYYKQFLLLFLFVLFAIVVIYGFSEGLAYLFTFPAFAAGIFLTFFLSKEFDKDTNNRIKKSVQYAKQDIEAEQWVEDNLTPATLKYIRTRRWTIIIYCVIFFLITTFMWSYLSSGLLPAVKDFTYAAILLWFFVMYILIVPPFYDKIQKALPKSLRLLTRGDWTRGYIFLFPITFCVYLVYPFYELMQKFSEKLFYFPLFFIVYTFAFVCLYCIVYVYNSLYREEKDRLNSEIKKTLND